MFGPPLHRFRLQIDQRLRHVRLRTGDILFRRGVERFYGIPFSHLVAKFTSSLYSHASVAIVENDEIRLVEVNLNGTTELRLMDWLDLCGPQFEVWRPKSDCFCVGFEEKLAVAARAFLKQDVDYNLQFKPDPKRAYCTESVEIIYKMAGLPSLCQGVCPQRLMSDRMFNWVFKPINSLMGMLTGASIPLDIPLTVVGNEHFGLMSSIYLEPIFKFEV